MRTTAAAMGLAVAATFGGCAAEPATRSSPAPGPAAVTAGACAWFGDARAETLYFGVSPFWSALRASGGDPRAETRSVGPREIGRFDLAHRRMLPPLAVAPAGAGVWDVLAHPNGWLYFTTFWERAGRVDPASGAVEWFDAAGDGLNELALLPDGRLLASRYGRDGASGSVVVLSERGEPLVEHALASAPGTVAAAKSVAYDATRDAVWLNTDLLPADGGPARHDARVLALADGRELARWSEPELQFVTFDAKGAGFLVERAEELLLLRVLPPDAPAPLALAGRLIPLDDAFPADRDFAQDVKLAPDEGVLVARWSGRVHVVSPDGRVRTRDLPALAGSLTYTAVAHGRTLCATRCAGIQVACVALPR